MKSRGALSSPFNHAISVRSRRQADQKALVSLPPRFDVVRLQVTLQSCVYDVCSENQCLFAESGEFRCGLLRRSIHYNDFIGRIEKLAWNCLLDRDPR